MRRILKNTFRFLGALYALARGIMVLCMLAAVIVAGYAVYVAATVTVDQYNESLVWERTSYGIPLSDVEPAVLRNVADRDAVAAAGLLAELEAFVDGLNGESIPDRDYASGLLSRVSGLQEAYGLYPADAERLALYLELEDAIPEAYASLDTGRLQELSTRLLGMEKAGSTPSGERYMERIACVAGDMAHVQDVLEDTIWSVGEVQESVWTVPYTYTRTDLTDLLDRVREMEGFPAVQSILGTLSDFSGVLNHNHNAGEYFGYQEFKKSFMQAKRGDYVAVSSIYTYGQALSFGCTVEALELEGYAIDPDSPVTGIYYEGEQLDDSQYVRKGTALTVFIDEIYEPVEMPQENDYGEGWEWEDE